MNDYLRVKQVETGHELSVPREHFDNAPAGAYEVLEDKEATDPGGHPLPAKYKTTVAEAAAAKAGQQAAPKKEKD